MLPGPAIQGEHDGSWDDVLWSPKKSQTEASEGAGDGRGTDSVGESGVEVIAKMDWSTARDVPPV